MKKIALVAGIVMLLASMVFAAGIKKGDLASLKGTWEGRAYTTQADGSMKLEILNDTEPIQGKATITNIDKLRVSDAPTWSGDRYEGQSDNGVITNKGTLMFTGQGGNVFEITSLSKDKSGKMTLGGWFFGKGARVDFSLKKK
jgi:hypothetical protein